MTHSVPIGSVVEPVPSKSPDSNNKFFRYVDLGTVDSRTKSIVEAKQTLTSEAPSRARQMIATHDVLVSTVRPNLNGVAYVDASHDGAIASTGFTVLRPRSGEIDPRYLFRWVQSTPFVSEMTRVATGASYPAVSDAIVKRSKIPLPPFPEQRRIAEILDRADALRAKRRQSMTLLDELAESTFNEVFGNVVRNDRGWKTAVISDFVTGFTTGKSVVGSGDDRDERSPRVLKISSVTTGTFLPNESKPLPLGYTPLKSHFVERGDLLFSRANTAELVGATAYVLHAVPSVTLPDKLWKFVWKRDGLVDPVWVWKALSRPELRRVLSDRATGSGGSMKNISQPALLRISIVLPPFCIQEDFARRILEIEGLRESHSRHLSEFDELFASIQHRAFGGEL